MAGVTPGRGGQIFDESVPVFDSMDEAVAQTGANTSLIFVPPPFAAEAVIEAVLSGMQLVICITEGVPVMDTVRVVRFIEHRAVTLIGPNCPWHDNPGSPLQGRHYAGGPFTCRGGWGWCPAAAPSPTRQWGS